MTPGGVKAGSRHNGADDPEKQVQEHQVLRLRVRPRPDATERKPLRGGGAPAVDGSIDGIQQARLA